MKSEELYLKIPPKEWLFMKIFVFFQKDPYSLGGRPKDRKYAIIRREPFILFLSS